MMLFSKQAVYITVALLLLILPINVSSSEDDGECFVLEDPPVAYGSSTGTPRNNLDQIRGSVKDIITHEHRINGVRACQDSNRILVNL